MQDFLGSRQMYVNALDFGLSTKASPSHNFKALQRAIDQAVSLKSLYVYVHPGTYFMPDVAIQPLNMKGISLLGEVGAIVNGYTVIGFTPNDTNSLTKRIDATDANLKAHVDNSGIHVTPEQKTFWDNRQQALTDAFSIEYGLNVQGMGSRYLDFHTHPGGVDKHARIIATPNQNVDNGADLGIEAKSVIVTTKDNNNSINLANIRINNGVFEIYDGTKWVSTMGTSMVTAGGATQYNDPTERNIVTGYSDPNNVNTRAASILIANHMVPAAGEVQVFFDFNIGGNWSNVRIFIGDRQMGDGRCEYDSTSSVGSFRTFSDQIGTDPTISDTRYSGVMIADTTTGWRSTGTTFKVQHAGAIQVIMMGQKNSTWNPNFAFKNVRILYDKK